MMRITEVQVAANIIGPQLEAGYSIVQVIERMATIQPVHEDEWKKITLALKRGEPLSKNLDGLWPENIIQAIKSGEDSGRLVDVFKYVVIVMEQQQRVKSTFFQLIYPFGIIGFAFIVFLFFMAYVLPYMRKNIGIETDTAAGFISIMFWISDILSQTLPGNEIFYLSITLAGSLAMYWLLTKTTFRESVVEFCIGIPVIGRHLTYIFFGIWAHYVSLLYASGAFDLKKTLTTPINNLPRRFHESVKDMVRVASKVGVPESLNLKKIPLEDQRHHWPQHIITAFINGYDTGKMDDAMKLAAGLLMKEGFDGIIRDIVVLKTCAIVFAGFMTITPFLPYFLQMGFAYQTLI